jgi:hypothetical protein
MASYVEICNIALSHIRGKSINALNESSIEAQQCSLHYLRLRDIVLRGVNWQFAKRTVVAQLLSDSPLEWTYAYNYPNDCLKIRKVTGDFYGDDTVNGVASRARISQIQRQLEDPPFALENMSISGTDTKVIGTDLPEARLIYTRKVTDPNLFDSDFEDAYAWLIAATIAIPVMGGDFGRKMREDALGMYRQMIIEAIATNGNERKRGPRHTPSLVQARTT